MTSGGLLGVWGKWMKHAKYIYNIQDFNPEQVLAVGYTKSKLITDAMMWFDKFSCKRSDLVITVGRDLVETVENRFKDKKVPKTVMINNWIDENEIYPLDESNEKVLAFKKKYGLGGKFVIMYAADVIVTYQVLPEKSAWLYSNVSDIKNLVGDELVASAIKSAMAELGPNEVTNRTKIEPLAQQKLAESLVQKYGDDVVFVNKVVINDMNFEDAYNEAIQQKSIAQQNADKQKIENEAAIAKAEADKQVAITNAEAEAQKTSIAADAQAEANRKLAESLSDTLIDYQKIQKWDGKLPTVSGGNALVSIDPAE